MGRVARAFERSSAPDGIQKLLRNPGESRGRDGSRGRDAPRGEASNQFVVRPRGEDVHGPAHFGADGAMVVQ